jgi:hypothetical protein
MYAANRNTSSSTYIRPRALRETCRYSAFLLALCGYYSDDDEENL